MSISIGRWIALAGWVMGAGLAACSASTPMEARGAGKAGASAVSSVAQAGSGSLPASGGATPAAAAPGGSANGTAAGSGAAGAAGLLRATPVEGCDSAAAFKKEGCSCRAGETAGCWTGPVADRNVGMCHDGLQICSGGSEFASWGPCMGEQKVCGTDAGVPPPPPDDEECTCIPGAVIQCSEDCSVGIICSLTASKSCLPDGTWSQCHEDSAVTLDLPGVQCRNMLHGCLDVLNTEGSTSGSGDGELFVGDCSKQFKCGHAPPPVKTPPETPTPEANPN